MRFLHLTIMAEIAWSIVRVGDISVIAHLIDNNNLIEILIEN